MSHRSLPLLVVGVCLAPALLSTACLPAPNTEVVAPPVAAIPVAPLAPGEARAGSLPVLPRPPARSLATLESPGDDPPPPDPPAAVAVLSPRVVLADELPFRLPPESADEPADPPRKKHRGDRAHHHPDPRVWVDVTDAPADADLGELRRAARSSGYWPFRRCYEEGLRRDQSLAGRVSLRLTVAEPASSGRASLLLSSLRDESVALCVGREARRLALPSSGRALAGAQLLVVLSTGDEPVTVPSPVPNAAALREELRASWPEVEQCFLSDLAQRQEAGGRLELRFRAHPGGEVDDVAGGGDKTFADGDTVRCVVDVYRAAKLPAATPDSGQDAAFVYAMHVEARP